MHPSNKIAINAGVLYGRVFITAGITLFTTRLALSILGVSDYGIYNLVSGMVLMLSFLSTALTVATQRNLSFHSGSSDKEVYSRVFSNSLVLHLIGGITIVFVLELFGWFLFDGFLNIPQERIYAAWFVYRMMICTIFFSLLSIPFVASMYAHEDMHLVAIIHVMEALLRLLATWAVLWVVDGDRLIYYGLFGVLTAVIALCLYVIFAVRSYEECRFSLRRFIRFSDIKKMGVFAGWNLFGALCTVGRTQGLALVLNLFLGVIINAAYAIASQLATYLSFFSTVILQSINPQIMKSEGNGDRKRMLRLSMTASKLAFFLLAFIAIPCLFEMKSLLGLWLEDVPAYSVIFCILIVLGSLMGVLTAGLNSAILAIGDIRNYQLISGVIYLINLPIAYLILKREYDASWALVGLIVSEFLISFLRMFFLKLKAGLNVLELFNKVFFREIIPVLLSVSVCLLITLNSDVSYRFLLTISLSIPAFGLGAYFFGLCPDEKLAVDRFLNSVIRRVWKK